MWTSSYNSSEDYLSQKSSTFARPGTARVVRGNFLCCRSWKTAEMPRFQNKTCIVRTVLRVAAGSGGELFCVSNESSDRPMQEWLKTPFPFQTCSIQKKCRHPAAPTGSQRHCIPNEDASGCWLYTLLHGSLCWLALPPATCSESFIGMVLHGWLLIIMRDLKRHSSRCTFVSSSNTHSFTAAVFGSCWLHSQNAGFPSS